MKESINKTISMKKDMLEQLEIIAKDKGINVSALIKMYLTKSLKEEGKYEA